MSFGLVSTHLVLGGVAHLVELDGLVVLVQETVDVEEHVGDGGLESLEGRLFG